MRSYCRVPWVIVGFLLTQQANIILLMVQNSGDSPVEVVGLSHHSQGFVHPRWLAGSEPTTLCLSHWMARVRYVFTSKL